MRAQHVLSYHLTYDQKKKCVFLREYQITARTKLFFRRLNTHSLKHKWIKKLCWTRLSNSCSRALRAHVVYKQTRARKANRKANRERRRERKDVVCNKDKREKGEWVTMWLKDRQVLSGASHKKKWKSVHAGFGLRVPSYAWLSRETTVKQRTHNVKICTFVQAKYKQ